MSHRDGITVVGRVTGRHPIKDLRTDIPFNVAVTFTNDQRLRSRDLQIAIQQGWVTVLDGTVQASNHLPPPPDYLPDDRLERLEKENRELREELLAEREEKRVLRSSLNALQNRLGDVLAAVERLGQGQVVQVVQGAVGAPAGPVGASSAPMYVPDLGAVEVEESRVEVETKEGTSVSAARNALKKLRSGQA